MINNSLLEYSLTNCMHFFKKDCKKYFTYIIQFKKKVLLAIGYMKLPRKFPFSESYDLQRYICATCNLHLTCHPVNPFVPNWLPWLESDWVEGTVFKFPVNL